MCLSTKEGKIDISIFFKIDHMNETIPTKENTSEISKFIHNETNQIIDLKDTLQNLYNEE